MKTLNFVTTMSIAIALAVPAFAQAQNYGSPNAGPTRTFLGLPIPQQWNSVRPASANQYPANGSSDSNVYYGQNPGNCVNGQCATGNCQTGNCATGRCATGNCQNGRVTTGYRMGDRSATGTCVNCNCSDGACTSGLCASGQCAACANGRCVGCTNGQCTGGQSVSGNCPNGQCSRTRNSNAVYNQYGSNGAQGDWTPRTTRSNTANPFRGAETQNGNDNWTQRPALRNPVNDLYPSRYNRDDLDLRRPYFNNQSGELNDTQTGENSSAARDIRAPRPSDRSMFGAPADRDFGMAQI